MKKIIKTLTSITAGITAIVFGFQIYYADTLPNSYRIRHGEQLKLAYGISANVRDSQTVSLNLLGVIPIKQVNVSEVDDYEVCVSGEIFGLKIFTKGVMVVGQSPVETESGNKSPADSAGIKIGDNIITIDGKAVATNEDVSKIISESNGKEIKIIIARKGTEKELKMRPVLAKDGKYKAGIWVRDSSAGIGTMTFYDPVTGKYAGLGHAVCDVDTGEMLPLSDGEIVKATVRNIDRSEKGDSGSLCGEFSGGRLGSLNKNTEQGVFGVLDNIADSPLMKIALKQQIKTGEAQVYVTLDENGPQLYSCEIESIRYNDLPSQNMVVRITDERLLERAGGIVQGMSGAPIVQNGFIVGAVTHVFVNDPKRGYAIFAENMYDNMKNVIG